MLFGALLTACTTPPAAPSTPAEPAGPTTIRIGIPEASPQTGGEFGLNGFGNLVSRDSLTLMGIDGRATPRMAESWVWENDFRRLRVVLRAGIGRHDGTPFTAHDAVGLLRDVVWSDGATSSYASFDDIAAIRALNDREIAIDLIQPSALLPEDLSVLLDNQPATGMGPFTVVEVELPNPKDVTPAPKELQLTAFDDYYAGRPVADAVVRPFDEMRSTWSSLLRNELDVVTNVPFDAVDFIGGSDVQILEFERWYQFIIAFNSKRPMFALPAVRKALNLAVDRDALVKITLDGKATPSHGPIWPKYWAYDGSMNPFPFDPKEAIRLLEGAGLRVQPALPGGAGPPARLRFTCLVPRGFTILERIAMEVRRSLFNIGVDMRVEIMPLSALNERVGARDFDAGMFDMVSGPTPGRPYNFWRSAKTFYGNNAFGYENAEAERHFTTIRSTTNEAAIRAATARLQQLMQEDPPALFLAWNRRARAVSKRFEIPPDVGRDPLSNLWKWKLRPSAASQAAQ